MTTVPAGTARRRDLVVVGASAGGVESLRAFVARLDADLPAVVLVVLHLPATGGSALPRILERVGRLPVATAKEDQTLTRGTIVVAPPDLHLVVQDDYSTVTRGPRENGHRPAVDVLFRSAARAAGARVISVVLSGALDDGTAGCAAVRHQGGTVLVQDPDEAAYPSMPRSVISVVGADHVAPAAELGELVNRLTRDPLAPTSGPADGPPVPALLTVEVDMAQMRPEAYSEPDRPGTPAGFSCPDCHGTLFDLEDTSQLRFRCRVGHAWTARALMAAQSDALDTALWVALRSLEEKAALSRQLEARAVERGNTLSGARYGERAREATRSAELLQQLLNLPLDPPPVDDPEQPEADRMDDEENHGRRW